MEIEDRNTLEEEMFTCFNNDMFEYTNENEQQDTISHKQQKIENDVKNLLSSDLINQINEDENTNEHNPIHTNISPNNNNLPPNNTNYTETSNSDIDLTLIEDETSSPFPNQIQPPTNQPPSYSTFPMQKLPFYPQLPNPSKPLPFFYNPPYSNIPFPKQGWLCTHCKCINYHIRNQCSHCGNILLRNYAQNPQSRFSQNNLHLNGNAFKFSPLLFDSWKNVHNLSGDNIKSGHNKLSPVMSPVSGSCLKKRKPFIEREGDWICAKCKNLNFAFRIRCNRCNKMKEGEEDIKGNSDMDKKSK